MTAINRLTSKEKPTSSDLAPIWDSQAGRTRNTPYSGVADFVGDSVNPITDVSSSPENITFNYYNGDEKVISKSSTPAFDTVAEMTAYTGGILPSDLLQTKVNNTTSNAGGAQYLVKTTSQATLDGDHYSPTTTGNRLLSGGELVAVIQQPYKRDLNVFGASGTSGFDNASIIEECALVNQGFEIRGKAGRYEVSRTVFIPIGTTINGFSGNRSFSGNFDDSVQFASQSGGTYVENFLFFMNINPSGDTDTWVVQFPNNGSGGAKNLSIDGSATNGINGFKFAGSHHFEEIDNVKVATLIEKPQSLYTDKVKVVSIHSRERADQSSYLVDLLGLGDAYEIIGIASGYTGNQVGVTNGLRLGATRGTDVYGIINGHNLLEGCVSVDIHGCHLETGSITLRDGNANIRDNILFNEEDDGSQVILESVGDTFNNRYEVTIENNIFDQSVNRRGGFQSSGTRPDIVVDPAFNAKLKNNKRKITDSTAVSRMSYMGAVVGTSPLLPLSDYNNYSHLFSNYECMIVNNQVIQTGTIPGQRLNFTGLTAGTRSFTDAGFTGATGTYFYTAQLIIDPERNIGRNQISAETSVSLVNGGAFGSLLIDWGSAVNRGGCIIRVYRGEASGSYNKFVEIPVVSLQEMFDAGNSLNGFAWIDRPSGSVGQLNAGMNGSVTLNDGYVTAHTNGGLPTAGTWRQGDTVIKTNITPPGAGNDVTTNYRRLTNGSGHALNTDWLPLKMTQ